MNKFFLSGLLCALIVHTGCYRGLPSEDPPVHPVTNMDTQEKYKPFRKNMFFDDHITMRLPVSGTVSRGDLREDAAYYAGKEKDGEFVKQTPVDMSQDVLYRGKERYNIYCSACHGGVGDGKGIILNYGLIPPTFHSDRLRSIEDGYIYDVITNGIRTMPSYRHSVPVQDRWAIILYVRALQRSQNASIQDIPEDVKSKILN